jgi:hypothetical protein
VRRQRLSPPDLLSLKCCVNGSARTSIGCGDRDCSSLSVLRLLRCQPGGQFQSLRHDGDDAAQQASP